MRYMSLSSLPDSPFSVPPDKTTLSLQRKKLLTELELSRDGSVSIQGRSYSRNDILEYFETLQDETVLRYHLEVCRDPSLVKFLEGDGIPGKVPFARAGIYEDPDFLRWISPFFYEAFVSYTRHCLQKNEEEGLQQLLQNSLLLTDYDREHAWIEIIKWLENNISRLEHFRRELQKNNPALSLMELTPLLANSYARMIRLFPQNALAGVRNRYAIALMQLSISVFNKIHSARDITDEWMSNAREVAVSEGVKTAIEDKITEMRGIRKKPGNKQSSMVVRAIIVIVVVLLNASNFLSGTDNSTDETPVVTRLDTILRTDTSIRTDTSNQYLRKSIDSMLKTARRMDSIRSIKSP